MFVFRSWMCLALALCAVSIDTVSAGPRPTVLWHGMGDTCCLPFSMGAVKKQIEKSIPGIYVKSIEIGNNQIEDELGGFLGNVNNQLQTVCDQLANDPQLADGFNAVGFSQGGQFLRAYVERCNTPPVYNLVTFGGQHMGVTEIPDCTATNTTICEIIAELLSMGVYADGVRDYSVQAQYFRSPYEYQKYIDRNIFLADINNERPQKNATYKKNLISLNKLVLIQFLSDTVVIPRASEWFGAFKEGAESEVIPMRQQAIYTEDWIGLKELDEANKIVEMGCPGEHMQFTMEYLTNKVVWPYLNNTISAA
eukprot:m.94823 g.94823  ORF g.94823 m.94823 type:complete len:309 (+) comp13028_c0_seq1:231-1157(+)